MTQWCIFNREERLGLLCGCNEIGTMRGFVEITLNDEDLDAGASVTASILSCEEVPTRKQELRSYLKFI